MVASIDTTDTTSATPLVTHLLPQSVGERRVVFHGLSWPQVLMDARQSEVNAEQGLRGWLQQQRSEK